MLNILDSIQVIIDFIVSGFNMVINVFAQIGQFFLSVGDFTTLLFGNLPPFFQGVASFSVGVCAAAIVIKLVPFIG